MKSLLDTCVIAELVKRRPSARVCEWVETQPEDRLYLSVLTLGEVRKGIARLPASRKRRRLEQWVEVDLRRTFHGRVLPVTAEIAERWGILSAEAQSRGRPVPVIDALLAATALVADLTLVTRNTRDVEASGARWLNPWEDAAD